jgi:hypothetical protein
MASEGGQVLEPLIGPDLVLLLLAAPTTVASAEDRINGITRLEKLLFLAEEEAHLSSEVEDPFSFVPYALGPYSKAIYEAVDLLEEAQLVNEYRALDGMALDGMEEAATGSGDQEGIERRFVLTADGKAVAGLLAAQHPEVVGSLSSIKNRYAGMPLRQLIRYVYLAHPEYAVASRIREEVLGGESGRT